MTDKKPEKPDMTIHYLPREDYNAYLKRTRLEEDERARIDYEKWAAHLAEQERRLAATPRVWVRVSVPAVLFERAKNLERCNQLGLGSVAGAFESALEQQVNLAERLALYSGLFKLLAEPAPNGATPDIQVEAAP